MTINLQFTNNFYLQKSKLATVLTKNTTLQLENEHYFSTKKQTCNLITSNDELNKLIATAGPKLKV